MPNTRQGGGASVSEDEYVEKLINKVCSKFINQLDKKIDDKMNNIVLKLDQVCESLTNINKTVTENCENIVKLQERVENLEQGHKRNSIRFCGIPESSDENLYVLISSFVSNQMKILCDERDIDYVFRTGLMQQHNNEKPRTIIAHFVRRGKRNEIFNAKKLLKGTPYSLYEDLTPKRYELLTIAKKKYGNTKTWSSAGNIFYWDSNLNRKIKITAKSDI